MNTVINGQCRILSAWMVLFSKVAGLLFCSSYKKYEMWNLRKRFLIIFKSAISLRKYWLHPHYVSVALLRKKYNMIRALKIVCMWNFNAWEHSMRASIFANWKENYGFVLRLIFLAAISEGNLRISSTHIQAKRKKLIFILGGRKMALKKTCNNKMIILRTI